VYIAAHHATVRVQEVQTAFSHSYRPRKREAFLFAKMPCGRVERSKPAHLRASPALPDSRRTLHQALHDLPSGKNHRERAAKEKAMNPTENRTAIANEELRSHGIYMTVDELKYHILLMRLAVKTGDHVAFGRSAAQIIREPLKVDAQPS
jgi:hypothetical protein